MNGNVRYRHASGSTLIMSLLIMVLVLSIAAGITYVLNGRTRVASFSRQGITAQYVSESAAELVLMNLTQSRFDRDTYEQTFDAMEKVPGDASYKFSHGGTIKTINVQKTTAQYKTNLSEDETVTLDLIQRDENDLGFTLDELNFSWDTIDKNEKLEIAWTGLASNDALQSGRTYLTFSDSGGADVDFGGFTTERGYRVTVKALGSGVNNLVMKPKGSGAPTIEPAFEVEVTGSFGDSEWTKRFVAPYRAPVTPLLQYVIFSDQTLSKPILP